MKNTFFKELLSRIAELENALEVLVGGITE